jgi:hypothetical protein
MSDQVIGIRPGQLGPMLRRQGREQAHAIARGIRRAKVRGIGVLKANTPKNDTGLLKNAWIVTESGVQNTAPYAGIIERGARPHMMNREGIAALTEWVRRKGLVVRMVKSGPVSKARRLTKTEASADRDVQSIVWAIVGKLKKEGQEGTFYIENSLPRLTEILEEEILDALSRSMGTTGGET